MSSMFRRLMMSKSHEPPTWIFGVEIDESVADPYARCTYTDDCAGYSPMSNVGTFTAGDWVGCPLWDLIYPVMRVGSTVTRLMKTDLTKDIDGNTVSTTANKFTHFEKIYTKMSKAGTVVSIKFSNVKGVGYSDWHFSRNGVVRNYFESGCYKAYNASNVLTSRTGVSPTVSVSLTNFITYAQSGAGSGYDVSLYNNLTYIQMLYVLLFKNTDSQAYLGKGYVGGSAKQNTGANNTLVNEYGMYGDTTASLTQVSFLWQEDIWGNIYEWIGGLKTDANYDIQVGDIANTTGTGYATIDTGLSASVDGYSSAVLGGEKSGFLPTSTASGSAAKYYCDIGFVYASAFPGFGGSWYYGTGAGLFALDVYNSATYTSTYIGARLSYGGE